MSVNLELLTQPFNRDQVRQREGAGRRMLDYVSSGDIIHRVIEATDNSYDWTVVKLEFVNDGKAAYWLCQGILTIPTLGSRSGAGSARLENEDSPKSAETDAFKRAAVKFGVALDLYFKGPAAPQATQGGYLQQYGQSATNAPARAGRGPVGAVAGINETGGPCPECHAPAGKRHATGCPNNG